MDNKINTLMYSSIGEKGALKSNEKPRRRAALITKPKGSKRFIKGIDDRQSTIAPVYKRSHSTSIDIDVFLIAYR